MNLNHTTLSVRCICQTYLKVALFYLSFKEYIVDNIYEIIVGEYIWWMNIKYYMGNIEIGQHCPLLTALFGNYIGGPSKNYKVRSDLV